MNPPNIGDFCYLNPELAPKVGKSAGYTENLLPFSTKGSTKKHFLTEIKAFGLFFNQYFTHGLPLRGAYLELI